MAGADIWTRGRRHARRLNLYGRFIARRLARSVRYRLRLQRDEYPSVHALPPLVEEPAPLFPAAQIALGRILGRAYLWFDRIREHFRIERSRIGDRFGGPRLTAVLIRRQVALLALVLALVVGGLAADVLASRYGRHLMWVPGADFAARHLNGPSAGTLNSALTATATATGAVLGLVLTISLITFQTTASRYRSDRIVAFLVREQVGSVVVRLLAGGFLFSLWLLFLRDVVTGYPPYISTALAVAVATAGIGSLIVYRQHALLGLAPANVFLALERELRRELSRVARKQPGRSVEAHARRTSESDLEIAKDLLATLSRESDWRGAAAGIAMLARVIDVYVPFKRRLAERSQWFRPMPVRLGAEAYEITLNFARLGRLPPTDMRPERDWLEREIYEAAAAVPPLGLADSSLREAIFILHGHALQLAWRGQEFEVLDRALDAAEALATAPAIVSSASRGFLELPWVAVYEFAHGLSPPVESMVATRPWEGHKASNLPRAARELADELGRKIRKEIAITGQVVTPEAAMIAELRPRWEQLGAEKQTHYLARALALATTHLHAVVEAGAASQAATAAEICVRTLVLAFAEGAKPALALDPIGRDLVDAYRLAPTATERTQLREEGVWVALRTLAERGELQLAGDLLEVALAMDLFEQVTAAGASGAAGATTAAAGAAGERAATAGAAAGGSAGVSGDAAAALRRFELLLQFAYVYGWAEYHQAAGVVERIAPLVSSLFDLEGLLPLLDKSPSVLTWPFASGVKHRTWFQPLRTAIYELPEVYAQEAGAFGYDVARDHPSPLIRAWADYYDIDEVVKAMVEAAVRFNVRHRVVELVEQRIKELGG